MWNDDNIFAGDADIEMADLQDIADREDHLKSKGICCHGWLQEHPDGSCTCKECGEVFISMDAAMEERHEALL